MVVREASILAINVAMEGRVKLCFLLPFKLHRCDRAASLLCRPHLLQRQPNYATDRSPLSPPAQFVHTTKRQTLASANAVGNCCRSVKSITNGKEADRIPRTLGTGKNVSSCSTHSPFPVIVQCCETEKAMCVDPKVNLAP